MKNKPTLFSITNGLHSEIMLTQIILVMAILKIVSTDKLQFTEVMTDFEHKYKVELESAIFEMKLQKLQIDHFLTRL